MQLLKKPMNCAFCDSYKINSFKPDEELWCLKCGARHWLLENGYWKAAKKKEEKKKETSSKKFR
jgi:hypothetical protein